MALGWKIMNRDRHVDGPIAQDINADPESALMASKAVARYWQRPIQESQRQGRLRSTQ